MTRNSIGAHKIAPLFTQYNAPFLFSLTRAGLFKFFRCWVVVFSRAAAFAFRSKLMLLIGKFRTNIVDGIQFTASAFARALARSNIHGAPYTAMRITLILVWIDASGEKYSFNTDELASNTTHNTSQNRPFGASAERFA